MREALFDILDSAGRVEGARVLDLYAGTGALGLEAVSRGATTAVCVESSRPAIAVLRQNIVALGLQASARIVEGEVERVARRIASSGPFDLVLVDPPWAMVDSGDAPRALRALVVAGILAPAAWLVLEHSSRTAPPNVEPLERVDSRAYGDTTLTFYKTAIVGDPSRRTGAESPSD